MRTKAFEEMVLAKTVRYPHNPINAIGQIDSIRDAGVKKKKTKKNKQSADQTTSSYGDEQYTAVGQFEVTLLDDTVLMTVGWDGEKLSFHYFGMTADESSAECLNEQYELGIVMRSLQNKK